jgi:hypothetical protein
MWGLVQRTYNGKSASLLLLKVSATSAEHLGAPLFEEGLVYTLTIGDKSQKVTPYETVGRLAIGFNLADYPALGTIESKKSYDVSLKIEKSDGTLLYEGTAAKVSSGKTDYLPVADFAKEEPAPTPTPTPDPTPSDLPSESAPQSPSESTSVSTPESGDDQKDDDGSFSPVFLIPCGVAVVIAIGGALFVVLKKKKA